jgi:hypothetical protein
MAVSHLILISTCAFLSHGLSVSFSSTLSLLFLSSQSTLNWFHVPSVLISLKVSTFSASYFLVLLSCTQAQLCSSLEQCYAPRFLDCYSRCTSAKCTHPHTFRTKSSYWLAESPLSCPQFPFSLRVSPVAIHLPWSFKHYAFPKRWLLGVKGHIPDISVLHSYCHEKLGTTMLELKLLRWTFEHNCKIWIMVRFIVPTV